MVYVLYMAVVLSNPEPLQALSSTYGFGIVFVGEKVTHALPLITVMFIIGLHMDNLRKYGVSPLSLETKRKIGGWHLQRLMRAGALLWWYFGPLIFAGIYRAVFDPWQVYNSRLTFWESFAVCVTTLVIVQTLLLLAIFYYRSRK